MVLRFGVLGGHGNQPAKDLKMQSENHFWKGLVVSFVVLVLILALRTCG